jgi:hypothetical protein
MARNVLAGDEDHTCDEDDCEDDELLVLEGGMVTIIGRSIDEDVLDASDHLGDD